MNVGEELPKKKKTNANLNSSVTKINNNQYSF